MCCLWGLIAVTFPGDLILGPEVAKPLLVYRLGVVVPGLIFISLMTNTRWYAGRVQLFATLFLCYGALVYVQPLRLLPDDIVFSYHSSAAASCFFIYALVRLRFWWATASGVLNSSVYILALMSFRDVPMSMAYNILLSLIIFNLIGMAVVYFLERNWRQSFLLRYDLEDSQRRNMALLSANPDALLVVSENKTVLHASAAISTLFDKSNIEKGIRFLWPQHYELIENMIEEALLLDKLEPLEILVEKNGRERTHELRFKRFDVDRVLIVVRDITARKLDEIRQTEFEFKRQQKHRLESLGVMAGGITHDFNSLLTVMLGQTELLLSKMKSGVPEELHRIRDAIGKASELTEKMLAYAGKTRLKSRTNDIGALVDGMKTLLEASAHGRAELRFDVSDDRPNVFADRVQLEQVLINFVTNAIEACEEFGDIQVNVGSEMLADTVLRKLHSTIELEDGEYVFMSVTDNGKGMSKDAVNRIFEPFYSTKFQGRGMGLASVLGIVSAHRGGISIETEEGKGTTMKAYFPVTSVETSQELSAAIVSHELSSMSGNQWHGKGTVLLADDDENVTLVSKLMLQNLGFNVLIAHGGNEAVKMYEEHHDDIRLVMLDMTMPDLGGDAVIEQIQAKYPSARVVINTAYTQAQLTDLLTHRDIVAGIIHKPYTMEELRVGLMNALNESATNVEQRGT